MVMMCDQFMPNVARRQSPILPKTPWFPSTYARHYLDAFITVSGARYSFG
jgi:hypothetical protein